MAHKTLVNGTAYEIKGGKTLVNGTAYSIKGGKTLVNGTAYSISFGKPIGSLAVGSSVYMNVNGVRTEFLVVNQGKPGSSSLYDDNCDGTWLLMKDLYESRQWHSSNVNDYANSTIHSYMNGTFLGLLAANIQAAIKQVKLPYRAGSGNGKTVTSGSNGLTAKIFLLSSTEVGFKHNYMPTSEGEILSYFSGCAANGADSKRVAYLNDIATRWWLRSPYCLINANNALQVSTDGDWYNYSCSYRGGVRPALVLPFETKVDVNFNIIT